MWKRNKKGLLFLYNATSYSHLLLEIVKLVSSQPNTISHSELLEQGITMNHNKWDKNYQHCRILKIHANICRIRFTLPIFIYCSFCICFVTLLSTYFVVNVCCNYPTPRNCSQRIITLQETIILNHAIELLTLFT